MVLTSRSFPAKPDGAVLLFLLLLLLFLLSMYNTDDDVVVEVEEVEVIREGVHAKALQEGTL